MPAAGLHPNSLHVLMRLKVLFFSWLHGAISGILAGGILGFGTADLFFVLHLLRDLAVMSGWLCVCFAFCKISSIHRHISCLSDRARLLNRVFLVSLFLVVLFGAFCLLLFFLLPVLVFGLPPFCSHPCSISGLRNGPRS